MRPLPVCFLAILFVGLVDGRAPGGETLDSELQSSPHRILYESYVGNNWELMLMNADGSGTKNLTNTPKVHEMYPQASPDGSKICFLADVDQDGSTLRSVYFMNTDGTGRVKVSDRARQPCWSPDGTKIAFVPQEFERFRVSDFVSKGMRFYDVRTGKTTEHINPKIHHLYGLSWSADGNWIVSTVHGGMGFGHAIVAIEVDGQRVHDLGISGCRPCLDPDGKRITWSRDDHTICVADVSLTSSGAKVSKVKVVHEDKTLHLYHPDFSPDGKYISFSVGPGGRVRADGPGTHTAVAEMVGVRGKWDLFARRANCEGSLVQLTHNVDLSNKESDWIRGPIATAVNE